MKLTSKLRTGALTGLMGLAGACSTMGPYETRDVCDSFFLVPGFLEPGACDNARTEIRARHAESRARQSQSGVTVATPEGYTVKLNKLDEIIYDGKKHLIEEINYPYIILLPSKKRDGYDVYDTTNSIIVPIKELFKK